LELNHQKILNNKIFLETLQKGIEELSLSISESFINQYLVYYNELIRWSKAYNITSLINSKDIATKLFLDSLLYLRFIPENVKNVIDVGSGGGFPGLVLKIISTKIKITLVEPSKKKSAFLRHIITLLKLQGIEVIQSDIEKFVKDTKIYFDVIITKALFSITKLIKKTIPIQNNNCILILSKGKNFMNEIKEAKRKIKNIDSLYIINYYTIKLPQTNIKRNIIVLQKKL